MVHSWDRGTGSVHCWWQDCLGCQFGEGNPLLALEELVLLAGVHKPLLVLSIWVTLGISDWVLFRK